MFIVESYALAVTMCLITMLCWGSWANTQKLAGGKWLFQLFYWDYVIGLFFLFLLMAMTMGSLGDMGRPFLEDIAQGDRLSFISAFVGGVIFNLANLLIVMAIEIAGMAVAFPIGIGIAMVLGVLVNYINSPIGNPVILFSGVLFIVIAIILNALAYRRLPTVKETKSGGGIIFAFLGGVLMGFFYRFVAASMSDDFISPTIGKFTPYTAVVVFAVGILVSNLLFNSYLMYRPLSGEKTSYHAYFGSGTLRLHLIGILGGIIWAMGTAFSFISSGVAGYAISYGLGQGAIMVATFWGVYIWKEFERAPAGTNRLIHIMFLMFFIGLAMIIYSRYS